MSRVAFIAGLATFAVPLFAANAAADIIQFESLDRAAASSDLVIRGDAVAIDTRKDDNGYEALDAGYNRFRSRCGSHESLSSFMIQVPSALMVRRTDLIFSSGPFLPSEV